MLKPEDVRIKKIEYEHGIVEYHVLVRKFKRNWLLEKIPTDEFELSTSRHYDCDEPAIFKDESNARVHKAILLDKYYRSLPTKITEL